MQDYLIKAENLISKHRLDLYIDILLKYWEEYPPTLGHGFSHVVKVAVESYQLGVDNNYLNPENLFIAGLFHDIFRPAEAKGGEEDQTYGASIVEKLFKENNISLNVSELVRNAILSHDDWKDQKIAPVFDLLLSTADKISHDLTIVYGYIWASNKFKIQKNEKPFFTSHLITYYTFLKYQQRAWEIFIKHPVKGTERAIEGYMKVNKTVIDNHLNDKEGVRFFEYTENVAQQFRNDEIETLKFFKRDDSSIKKLMMNCY